MRSTQVPLLRQGELAHSSVSDRDRECGNPVLASVSLTIKLLYEQAGIATYPTSTTAQAC